MGTVIIVIAAWLVVSVTIFTVARFFNSGDRATKRRLEKLTLKKRSNINKEDYFYFINEINVEYYSGTAADRFEAEAKSKDLIRRSLELVERREAERAD